MIGIILNFCTIILCGDLLQKILVYQWLEESLRCGEKVSEDLYDLRKEMEKEESLKKALTEMENGGSANGDEKPRAKLIRSSSEDLAKLEGREASNGNDPFIAGSSPAGSYDSSHSLSPVSSPRSPGDAVKVVSFSITHAYL